MARTKYNTANQTGNVTKIRMPDGTYEKTHYKEYRIGKTLVYMARCTISLNLMEELTYLVFETGFKKGEFGLYLPCKKMWVFKRTAPTEQEFKRVCKEWRQVFLGNGRKAVIHLFEELAEAPSRKEAFRIRNKYYAKYGFWQFGRLRKSKTRGKSALLERQAEFYEYLERKPFVTVDKQAVQTSYEPRIAWLYKPGGG